MRLIEVGGKDFKTRGVVRAGNRSAAVSEFYGWHLMCAQGCARSARKLRALLLSPGSKTRGTRVTEVNCFVFKVGRFHLNSQMIDPKTIQQFRPQVLKQIRL